MAKSIHFGSNRIAMMMMTKRRMQTMEIRRPSIPCVSGSFTMQQPPKANRNPKTSYLQQQVPLNMAKNAKYIGKWPLSAVPVFCACIGSLFYFNQEVNPIRLEEEGAI